MQETKQLQSPKTLKKEGILYTQIGSKMQPVYKRVYDPKTGKSIVKQTGEFDIDEFIQASNCKTDLAMLRAEMISTGQLPTISDDVIDGTLFPENIHQLYDTINSVDKVYNSLPDSVKAIFGNKDVFMAALVDGSYGNKIVESFKNEGQVVQEEKKEGNE